MSKYALQPITPQVFDHTSYPFTVRLDMESINKGIGNDKVLFVMGPDGKEVHVVNVADPICIYRDYGCNSGTGEFASVISSVNGLGLRSRLGFDYDYNRFVNNLKFLGFADSPGSASPNKSKNMRNFTVAPKGLISTNARKPIQTGANVMISVPRNPNEIEKYENEPESRIPIYIEEEKPEHETERIIQLVHQMIKEPDEVVEEIKKNGSTDSDVSDYFSAGRAMYFSMFSGISFMHALFKSGVIQMTEESGINDEYSTEEKITEMMKLCDMFEEPEMNNDVDPETKKKWKRMLREKFLPFVFWKASEEAHQFDKDNVIFSDISDLLNTSTKNHSEAIVVMQHNAQRLLFSATYSFFLNCQNRKVGKAVRGQPGKGKVDILFG